MRTIVILICGVLQHSCVCFLVSFIILTLFWQVRGSVLGARILNQIKRAPYKFVNLNFRLYSRNSFLRSSFNNKTQCCSFQSREAKALFMYARVFLQLHALEAHETKIFIRSMASAADTSAAFGFGITP